VHGTANAWPSQRKSRNVAARRRNSGRRYAKPSVFLIMMATMLTTSAISGELNQSNVSSKLDRITYVISPLLRESP
jgi:hypothetical protein